MIETTLKLVDQSIRRQESLYQSIRNLSIQQTAQVEFIQEHSILRLENHLIQKPKSQLENLKLQQTTTTTTTSQRSLFSMSQTTIQEITRTQVNLETMESQESILHRIQITATQTTSQIRLMAMSQEDLDV
jgi:hypothetical protein